VNSVTHNTLTQRIKLLGNLPAMPSILAVLCDELSARTSNINIDRIVENILYDKSLAAQCLRLANSPLFRQRGDVATVKEAVLALGLWRIRDLAFSCSMPLMFTQICKGVRREAFWRHSLGVALLSQKLEQEFSTNHKNQAYLRGLLHDIGLLVNGMLFPQDFRDVLEEAIREKAPIKVMEERVLGFTHTESGRILAELWRLPLDVSEVIEFHHKPNDQSTDNELTLIVSVADGVCRRFGLDYGYTVEERQDQTIDELWATLDERFPKASAYSEEEYNVLLQSLIAAARSLADHVLSPATPA
jgi:HD-like signal output (HDOD) protein